MSKVERETIDSKDADFDLWTINGEASIDVTVRLEIDEFLDLRDHLDLKIHSGKKTQCHFMYSIGMGSNTVTVFLRD